MRCPSGSLVTQITPSNILLSNILFATLVTNPVHCDPSTDCFVTA